MVLSSYMHTIHVHVHCTSTVQALYTCVQCQYKVCVCILSIIQMKHIKNSMMDAGSMFKMFTAGVGVCAFVTTVTTLTLF